MRLKAVVTVDYLGQVYPPGFHFDALDSDAQDMINRDIARVFNLEDPATSPPDPTTLEELKARLPKTADPEKPAEPPLFRKQK